MLGYIKFGVFFTFSFISWDLLHLFLHGLIRETHQAIHLGFLSPLLTVPVNYSMIL